MDYLLCVVPAPLGKPMNTGEESRIVPPVQERSWNTGRVWTDCSYTGSL